MKLISLPDCKQFHPELTLGKAYTATKVFGNGYIINTDNDVPIIILKERFSHDDVED